MYILCEFRHTRPINVMDHVMNINGYIFLDISSFHKNDIQILIDTKNWYESG